MGVLDAVREPGECVGILRLIVFCGCIAGEGWEDYGGVPSLYLARQEARPHNEPGAHHYEPPNSDTDSS